MYNTNNNDKNITPKSAQFMAAGDIRKFIHDLNNHLAIIEAFLSMADPDLFDSDVRQLYINAKRSFAGIREMVR